MTFLVQHEVCCYCLVMKHDLFSLVRCEGVDVRLDHDEKSIVTISWETFFLYFFFIQRPRSGVHISWNTPVSLAKSNQSLQFRNANPETPWCMIWSLFHSMDTPQGDLHHSCVTTSRLTYFILQAHAGTGISHREKQNNSGEVKKTTQVNDPGR